MGVAITDDTGAFVGAENLAEQIKNLVSPAEPAQDGQNAKEGQEPTDGEKPAQEGSQGAGEPEMVTGHLDAAQLEEMKKDDLEKLAADMGNAALVASQCVTVVGIGKLSGKYFIDTITHHGPRVPGRYEAGAAETAGVPAKSSHRGNDRPASGGMAAKPDRLL